MSVNARVKGRKRQPHPLASDLATRLLELRGHLGLSQEAFGRLFCRSRKQPLAWEKGKQLPGRRVLALACETYGWPMEMFEEGGRRPAALVNRLLTDGSPPSERALLDIIRLVGGAVTAQGEYITQNQPVPWEVAFDVYTRVLALAKRGLAESGEPPAAAQGGAG